MWWVLQALFMSLYKNFRDVLMERLDDAFGENENHEHQAMAVDVDEEDNENQNPAMDMDKENGTSNSKR